MKLLLIAIVSLLVASPALGQSEKRNELIDREIRLLDLSEADAVLRADYSTIDQLWAEDLLINNPFNEVVKGNKGPIRTGTLIYSSFVREIESVQIHGDTIIVMGRERVVPKGTSPDAGKTIHRRYTNIWMKRAGKWRLTARHANVVCQS